jgi:hypothetical protein
MQKAYKCLVNAKKNHGQLKNRPRPLVGANNKIYLDKDLGLWQGLIIKLI